MTIYFSFNSRQLGRNAYELTNDFVRNFKVAQTLSFQPEGARLHRMSEKSAPLYLRTSILQAKHHYERQAARRRCHMDLKSHTSLGDLEIRDTEDLVPHDLSTVCCNSCSKVIFI